MRRMIAATLVVVLLITVYMSALAEDIVTARTGIADADEVRLHNIELVTLTLDGAVIPSGASFSFNAITGSCDESSVYIRARDGACAYTANGGVDQLATTLYLALIQLGSDIRIDEKHSYGKYFSGSYVTDGDIAMVASVLWLAIKGMDSIAVVEKSTYGRRIYFRAGLVSKL